MTANTTANLNWQPLDEIDHALCSWLETQLDGVEVVLDPKRLAEPHGGLGRLFCWLLSVSTDAPEHSRSPIGSTPFWLRYAICLDPLDPAKAHRDFGHLLLAAMQHPQWDLETGTVPEAFWPAIGYLPGPAFVLVIPWKPDRPEPKRVEHVRHEYQVHEPGDKAFVK